jgi:hypothetical protein
MKFVIVKPNLSEADFIKLLIDQFPDIKDDIIDEDYEGLIHMQVGCLADYANKCIANGRLDEVRRVFDFFEKTVEKVDSKVENALYVSFLEHVDMDNASAHASAALKLLNRKYIPAYTGLRNFMEPTLKKQKKR